MQHSLLNLCVNRAVLTH